MSGSVNTGFVLDMQRKLYRWSDADPDKVFADLFNLVCDRRTLMQAWQRLARNRGSQHPGTDRHDAEKVEERPMASQVPRGYPRGTSPRNLQTRTCSATAHPEAGQAGAVPSAGDSHAQRPTGADGFEAGSGTHLRGGFLPDLVWVPARPKHP